MAIRPILIDKESPFLGENCALCKEPFTHGEAIVVCPEDATRHHIQCWTANGNRCTNYACTGRGEPITRSARSFIDEEEADEVVEPLPHRRRRRAPRAEVVTPASKVKTLPSSSFSCAQSCLVLSIALAIIVISVSCFGLWAIADYIMMEVLHWEYRDPLSLLFTLPELLPHLALLLPLA